MNINTLIAIGLAALIIISAAGIPILVGNGIVGDTPVPSERLSGGSSGDSYNPGNSAPHTGHESPGVTEVKKR